MRCLGIVFLALHSPEAAAAKICLQEVDHNIKRIAGGIHIDLVSDEFPYGTAVYLKIRKSSILTCLNPFHSRSLR
jgi:hypothetical protein